GRLQAETPEGAAGADPVADLQAFEQGGRGAAGHVADRDLDQPRLVAVAARGQRVGALGGRAVAVGEVHLQELPGDVVERLAIVADEGKVGHAGRQHAARGELEGELDDRHLPILPGCPPHYWSRTCARPTTTASSPSKACRWRSRRETSTRCSAPTAPASPRSSASSARWSTRPRARSGCSARTSPPSAARRCARSAWCRRKSTSTCSRSRWTSWSTTPGSTVSRAARRWSARNRSCAARSCGTRRKRCRARCRAG